MLYTIEHHHYYYILNGLIPFEVVLQIDKETPNEIVRLHGYAGGISPYKLINYLYFLDEEGNKLIRKTHEEEMRKRVANLDEHYRFVDNPALEGEAFADCYHIDQEKWIAPVVKILKRNGLYKPYPTKITTTDEHRQLLNVSFWNHVKEHDTP